MFEELRKLYSTGATFDVAFRKERLRRLAACLEAERGALESALKADLGKSAEEAWLTEIGFVEREIAHALRHIDRWMRDKSVRTPLFMFPGKSRLVAQPRGLVLIISPWNYPIQLSLSPLVAALSAGNVAVVKPSEFAPATSHWLAEHLPKVIGSDVVAVVEGGVPETTEILAQKFDFIFFTGSTRTAKVIAHAAAEHLTPTVLEVGGTSPCIVARWGGGEPAAEVLAILQALRDAGGEFEDSCEQPTREPITKQDFFALGLSGKPDSAARRGALLKGLDLPAHMSANALLQAVNTLFSREEFLARFSVQ